MDVSPSLKTERLLIRPLALTDDDFIFELVNTEGWIRFIGNRNIPSQVEARAYIQKVLENENVSYWVVQRKNSLDTIGIITYIKRDYLEHHDIGFAFLPNASKSGYAYEATRAVLHKLIQERNPVQILATTIPENERSIKLLQKIGFVFEKEMNVDNTMLHVYGALTDTLKT